MRPGVASVRRLSSGERDLDDSARPEDGRLPERPRPATSATVLAIAGSGFSPPAAAAFSLRSCAVSHLRAALGLAKLNIIFRGVRRVGAANTSLTQAARSPLWTGGSPAKSLRKENSALLQEALGAR